MSARVFVQVDGLDTPVPLDELAWEYVAPCGCTCGVMVAETADEEAASRQFTPNAEMRRRDVKAGYVFRLAPHFAVIDRLRARNECPHDPKFGAEKVRVPDGYQWAEAGGRRLLHLVAVPADQPKNFQLWSKHVHASKRDQSDWWTSGWLGETPTCRTCERWAQKQASAAGESS